MHLALGFTVSGVPDLEAHDVPNLARQHAIVE